MFLHTAAPSHPPRPVLSKSGQEVWHSHTAGKGPSRLVVQDDGNAVTYRVASNSASNSTAAPAKQQRAANGTAGSNGTSSEQQQLRAMATWATNTWGGSGGGG